MADGTEATKCFTTYTGKLFDPCNPDANDIDIIDIAHALSLTCRWAGHCSRFYSVAEHSIYVSLIVPPHLALEGLMHDATEAYLHDISRPLKAHLWEYRKLEAKLHAVIAKKYGFMYMIPEEVHIADNQILVAEAYHLKIANAEDIQERCSVTDVINLYDLGVDWNPLDSGEEFLRLFYAYSARR